MIKLFGKEYELMTEDGFITKTGYRVLTACSVLGMGIFLVGRRLYGKALEGRSKGTKA